ncbi:hypothetical protein MAH1_33840 [Sessilibacter sp. MAH1]
MATRTQIREAVKARINTFFNTTFSYAPPTIFEEELPAAAIYFEDGETERTFDDGRADTDGRLNIEITLRAESAADNIDARLDEKTNDVEAQLRADNTLGGLVDYIARVGFSYDRDQETSIASINLICTVNYQDED